MKFLKLAGGSVVWHDPDADIRVRQLTANDRTAGIPVANFDSRSSKPIGRWRPGVPPTVSRGQDLYAVAVGGTEDHLPHGGLDGMVDAVLGLGDHQIARSGVGQRQCDTEQANCPVAQTLKRDRPFAALEPDCDSPSVLAATPTPKHCHALHLVAEDEVEGRHREILLFGERDVVPKSRRILGRQRFGADGFAFGSWEKSCRSSKLRCLIGDGLLI